jgi:hypothetical protein
MEVELRREVERLADTPGEVGDAEAGEEVTVVELGGGEGDGDVDHHRLLAGLRGGVPEGDALPAVDHAGTRRGDVLLHRAERGAGEERRQREDDDAGHSSSAENEHADQRHDRQHDQREDGRIALAEEQRLLRLIEGGEDRQVRFRIAAEEVEDAGAAGIDAGRERGPRHRRLRRHRRPQRPERPFGAQAGEVRQLPFVHPPFGVSCVDPVEPQHDDLLNRCRRHRQRENQSENEEESSAPHRAAS